MSTTPPYDNGGDLPRGTLGPSTPVPGSRVEVYRTVVGDHREGEFLFLAGTADGTLELTTNLPAHRAAALLVRAAGVLRGDVTL